MQTIDASVLFVPETESLRFLPEGPYRCPDGRLSWVGIQSGPDATTGSLNLLDLASGQNESFSLAGRPGFAFSTDRAGQFVIGLERSVVIFDTRLGSTEVLIDGVDSGVKETIINDGLVYDGHLVFGCKHLKFADRIAGLYLLRRGEKTLIQLADNQICSNGKAIRQDAAGRFTLFDICSPSKQVLAWDLDFAAGTLSNPRVTVDLTAEAVFPDGMLMTPDEKSLIIAIYDPRDSDHGEARQYGIASGELQTVWRCAASPRVTCPQLVERNGRIELLLTTADEGMTPELRAKSQNAGCLFVGPTDFETLNDAPVFPL